MTGTKLKITKIFAHDSDQAAFDLVVDYYWKTLAKKYAGIGLTYEEQENVKQRALQDAREYWENQGYSFRNVKISEDIFDRIQLFGIPQPH